MLSVCERFGIESQLNDFIKAVDPDDKPSYWAKCLIFVRMKNLGILNKSPDKNRDRIAVLYEALGVANVLRRKSDDIFTRFVHLEASQNFDKVGGFDAQISDTVS